MRHLRDIDPVGICDIPHGERYAFSAIYPAGGGDRDLYHIAFP